MAPSFAFICIFQCIFTSQLSFPLLPLVWGFQTSPACPDNLSVILQVDSNIGVISQYLFYVCWTMHVMFPFRQYLSGSVQQQSFLLMPVSHKLQCVPVGGAQFISLSLICQWALDMVQGKTWQAHPDCSHCFTSHVHLHISTSLSTWMCSFLSRHLHSCPGSLQRQKNK